MSDTTDTIDELDFEQAFAQLEDVVSLMSSEELPLDKALALFEQGQLLAARCQALLDAAELKVQQFTSDTGELRDFPPLDG